MARWKDERTGAIYDGKDWVKRIAERMSWEVEWRNPNYPVYQLARVNVPGFSLIVYPHKTTAGNHHMRMRDAGSKDKSAYIKAVEEFYANAEVKQ